MADYGVTELGFNRPFLPEIRDAIIDELKVRFPNDTFSTDPSSLTGAIIDVHASKLAEMWEVLESIYFSMFPSTAYGKQLDEVVSMAGITRKGGTPSTAVALGVINEGDQPVSIPQGMEVKSSITDNVWEVEDGVDIDPSLGVNYFSFEVNNSNLFPVHFLMINGTTYIYMGSGKDPVQDIIQGICSQIQDGEITYTISGTVGKVKCRYPNTMTVSGSATILFKEYGSEFILKTKEDISEAAAPNSLVIIEGNAPQNLAYVTNESFGIAGSHPETDEELRRRFLVSLPLRSSTMIESIESHLINSIPDIEDIRIYENDTDVVDMKEMPPHSILVIIKGGAASNHDIAEKILQKKAAGIKAWAGPDGSGLYRSNQVIENVDVVVGGLTQTFEVGFARPVPMYLWVLCEYEGISFIPEQEPSESPFPLQDGERIIKEALMRDFSIGKDVITQSFYGPVYRALDSVGNLRVSTFLTDDSMYEPSNGEYSAGNKKVWYNEIAVLDPRRIIVSKQTNGPT